MTPSILTYLKTKHLYLGIVRYSLGAFMLTYSITKILKTQFALPGFVWTETQTLETMPSKQLAWVFLGYSTWFQVLLGFLELCPALLLFFKRATLLGAILMLPVTLNVVLINYALDLWDGTKILSLILLFLNLLVFAFEWSRIKSIFSIIIGTRLSIKLNIAEIVFNIAVILTVTYFSLQQLLVYTNQTNALTGDWLHQHPIEWTLVKEESKDSVLATRNLKLYFWAYGIYKEVDETNEVGPTTYSIDERKRQLMLRYDDGEIIRCNYSFPSETELKIEMTKNHSKITQYFEKRIINENRN
ncbi:hypothetical protein D3C87_216010 [compost metagenome]